MRDELLLRLQQILAGLKEVDLLLEAGDVRRERLVLGGVAGNLLALLEDRRLLFEPLELSRGSLRRSQSVLGDLLRVEFWSLCWAVTKC